MRDHGGFAMQIVRTIFWLLILVGVLVFSIFNWNPVEVTIWDNLVVETKVPALVIISSLRGFLPIWLYARGVTWSLNRKIRSLEIAAKASSVSAAAREAEREEEARQDAAEPVTEEPAVVPVEADTSAEAVADPVAQDTRLTADDAPADAPAEPETAPNPAQDEQPAVETASQDSAADETASDESDAEDTASHDDDEPAQGKPAAT